MDNVNKLETKLEDMGEDFHNHEKNFIEFKAEYQAVSRERHANLSEKIEEMLSLIRIQADSDSAQTSLIIELNNRLTTLETEKRTEMRMNKVWLAVGMLGATIMAGPASIIFQKML